MTEQAEVGQITSIVGRQIDGGMHEDIDVTNFGSKRARFDLALKINGDFADIFEVKADTITRRGEIVTDWRSDLQALTTRYRNKDFSRAFRVTARNHDSRLSLANGELRFVIEMAPGATWHACLFYDFADDNDWSNAPPLCVSNYDESEAARLQKKWRDTRHCRSGYCGELFHD